MNSTCISHDTYLNYSDNVDYLLQLEYEAIKYIKANVSNRYCRNYLKAALCVTIYPPCDNGAQKLCSEECNNLLNSGTCSSDTTNLIEYINRLSSHSENFIIDCSNSLIFSKITIPCQDNNCISLLNITESPAR